jgi:predicted Zn-ribbon and HTH transcriptional regulator
VADIFAAYAESFLAKFGEAVSSAKRRVLRALIACRTAVLGGHADRCDACGLEEISYNSCRNRHCPKCQAAARAEWLDARQRDLLPVCYYHVVFTVPPVIADLALQNKAVLYDILMRASAATLLRIAANPKHLGARIGFLSILHTWGQNLLHHPHVHCVVTGGGLSPDGQRWVSCRPEFFLPVPVLSKLFRGKFLAMARRAFAEGKLRFQGQLAHLNDARAFAAHLSPAYEQSWVVYAKKPFGGPLRVLKYLARYTHRVAISNHRLVSMAHGRVSFRWKDYAHGGRKSIMTLDAVEFIRRFLLHVLPRAFVRIRHYGLLANAQRTETLARCRQLLGCLETDSSPSPETTPTTQSPDGVIDTPARCPVCKVGHMIRYFLDPEPSRPILIHDTS